MLAAERQGCRFSRVVARSLDKLVMRPKTITVIALPIKVTRIVLIITIRIVITAATTRLRIISIVNSSNLNTNNNREQKKKRIKPVGFRHDVQLGALAAGCSIGLAMGFGSSCAGLREGREAL